jgi:hypothetical protein
MEYLNFTVDSALLRELGEKLVESVHLALAELIKNSYDADATEVTVRFTQDDEGNDEIHIIDNGIGMNFREVEEYWMRIATTNKNKNRLSPLYGRPKTGERRNRPVLLSKIGGKIETHHRGGRDQGHLNRISKNRGRIQLGSI